MAHRCGLLAIDLLYGHPEIPGYPKSYEKSLHPRLIQLLLHGDGRVIDGLYKYRNRPLFSKILSRPLSTETIRSTIFKLNNAGPAYTSLLTGYDKMTDAGLAEEVGPPGPGGWIPYEWIPLYYTVYEVPRKIMQGRDPSTMDWVQAAIDPFFLVIDLLARGWASATP